MSDMSVQGRPLLLTGVSASALTQGMGGTKDDAPVERRGSPRPEQPDLIKPQPRAAGEMEALRITPEEKAAYETLNALMMKRYAKYEEFVPFLKDPDAYIKDLRGRFEAQKAITPDDPHQFDFSDFGIPTLKQVQAALGRETITVASQAAMHEHSFHVFGGGKKREEYEVGLKLMAELQKEISGIVDRGHVSYRRLQELAYFSTNAMGYFDKLTLKEKALLQIDRHVIEGHEDVSIQELYHRYKRNSGFAAFSNPSMNSSVEKHRAPFEYAMFNKEKLDFINLPTMRPIGKSLFMRFLPYPIYFSGIGENPIPADGFMRPGGDFYLHDMRHNSSIYGEMQDYIARHKLSEPQVEKLRKTMDLWQVQLNEAQAKIGDKQLKEAVGLKTFSHHHDSGERYLPSLYMEHGGPKNAVLYFTYFCKAVSGQENGFTHPFKNLGKATDFLNNFWQTRYPIERSIIECRPVDAK
jgi:hypothetical protein